MKIKIAVPKTELTDKLIANLDKVKSRFDVEVFRVPEKKALELLIGDSIAAAAVSPITYAQAADKVDLRIVPGPAIALIGYTRAASIFFNKDLKDIKTVASNFEDAFLARVGAALLGEKFDMDPALRQTREPKSEVLNKADAAIVLGASDSLDSALDVGEEWFDAYETPLPVAFWVVRADSKIENIEKILADLAEEGLKGETEIVEKEKEGKPYLERKGSILWEFNDDFENALREVSGFLFYRQIIDLIPKIKVLGREDDEEIDAKK